MYIELLLRLVRDTCTVAQVKDLLASHQLKHNAAKWDDLIEKFVKPAIKDKTLPQQALLDLLQDIEEHGYQHVFLYTTPSAIATQAVDQNLVTKRLKTMSLEDRIDSPKLLDKPANLTLAAVRFEKSKTGKSATFKFIQKHEHREYSAEGVQNGQLVVRYDIVESRIVDLLKVEESGNVEVRLGKRKSASKYEDHLQKFWNAVAFLISKNDVTEVSLSRAKDFLIKKSSDLKDTVRYSTSTLGNDSGYKAKFAAGGKEDTLTDDDGCRSGLKQFLDHQGHCHEVNIWFTQQVSGVPGRDLHVLIQGELNEYSLPSRCNKIEYEFVLEKLRSVNKPIP